MKKILLSIVLFLLVSINIAQAAETPTEITFIYINGSNNLAYKNRLKFKVAFVENVQKLHPQIMKRFEANKMINERFLKGGKYTINPEPIAFYWGDRSLDIVEVLDKDLKTASKYSPKIAHQVRSIFAHCLHDAVWVQKQQNMNNVIDDLHQVVLEELAKGKKVVLLGYSAGSFVTYQYYLMKANTITPSALVDNYSSEINEYIANTSIKPTCFDALVDADIVKYNPKTDKFRPNPNLEAFKKNYAELDSYTDKVCFAGGDVKGVIGFASPARLFYSDLMDEKTSISNISRLMSQSIVENDVFYLTVNYSNDPFGFPNGENFTYKKLQNEIAKISNNFKGGQGFIYNKSNNYVPRTFVTAHLAYWDTPKRFAKAIVKAFNEGYLHFHELEKWFSHGKSKTLIIFYLAKIQVLQELL